MNEYHLEVRCRDIGAQGIFEYRTFRDVPMTAMTSQAAIEALSAFVEINHVRTIWSKQGVE